MSDLPFTPLGIVRCRDLVQVGLGIRATTFTRYRQGTIASTATANQILQLDPRRISYQVVISLVPTTGAGIFELSSSPLPAFANGMEINMNDGTTFTLVRDWRKDLDSVCEPLFGILAGGNAATIEWATLEVLLGVLPADEPVS